MHNCVKTNEQLVDLVFNELEAKARRRVLAEIAGCQHCLAQYQAMTETLRVFDQAAEVGLPGESYWVGYEARLRTRLEQKRQTLKRRLADWIAGLGLLTLRPLPLTAGLVALFLLALGWWDWQRRQIVAPAPHAPELVRITPTPSSQVEPQAADVAVTPKPNIVPNRQKLVHPRAAKPLGRPTIQRADPPEETVAVGVEAERFEQPLVVNSLFNPETAKHFEKAQLLLRSFRNASAAKGSGRIDLAYEKQLSQRLLYQNILLRRDAEMKGNLPAEEALNSLEPFLLDIANLPDRPLREELNGIRERLQRRDLIVALQINATQAAWPTFQNP
jgi:anti-sigma factor RsiW